MSFFEEVYDVVRRIPEGRVTTYGQIARIIGQPRKSKIVGWALHVNPYRGEVPCHRVVNRLGELSGSFAFGGIEVQKRLLMDEGIKFRDDGTIDLKEFIWEPDIS